MFGTRRAEGMITDCWQELKIACLGILLLRTVTIGGVPVRRAPSIGSENSLPEGPVRRVRLPFRFWTAWLRVRLRRLQPSMPSLYLDQPLRALIPTWAAVVPQVRRSPQNRFRQNSN